MADIRLHIEGADRNAVADEIEAFLAETFDTKPTRLPVGRAGGGAMRSDPAAVAALVLSVPGAVMAAMDMAERMRLKDKLGGLIALARRRRESGTVVRLETANGLKDLGRVDSDELIDAAQYEE